MTARLWALLLVLCGTVFLEGIDVAMFNVAVPSIRHDLGISVADAQWVISAYVLGYAGFLLFGGRCADLFGRRRVFLTALVVFVAFSGVGGFAQDAWVLVVARFVTGVSAGFMTPASLSIITTSFPEGNLRNRALVIFGAVGGAGFALGTVVGGLLTSVSWRWVFFAPVIVGAMLLVASRPLIRPDGPRVEGRFDIGGAMTATGGMVGLVLALILIGEHGAIAVGILVAVAAVLLLIGFVTIERRVTKPLVRLAIFRHGRVTMASTAGLLYMAGFFGFQFAATLYLQDLLGWTPLQTGLAFAIMGVDLVIGPLFTPRLVRRFGAVPVMVAGFVAAGLAYAWAVGVQEDWGYLDLLPSLFLVGVAFALAAGPMALTVIAGVSDGEHGLANGILNTAYQLGAAVGIATVTIVVTRGGHGVAGIDDYRLGFVVPLVLVTLAITAVAASSLRRRL